jgi:hypothetical protein
MNAAVERLVCSVAPVEAVLRLSKHFPVFPCRRYPENVMVRGALKLMKAKSPLTQHGLHDASQDESTIRAWWAQWPRECRQVAPPSSSLWISMRRKRMPRRMSG